MTMNKTIMRIMMFCAALVTLGIVRNAITLPDLCYQNTAKHDCVFCKIVAGKAPATVIYETADIMVIKKPRQVDGVDCLIIPKKHIENLFDLAMEDPYDARIINEIMDVALHVSTMITGKGHFTLVNNNGKDAYQSVFHMHWHFKAPNSNWKPDVVMTQSGK